MVIAVDPVRPVFQMARKYDLQQFFQDIDDDILIRLVEPVLPVDGPVLSIILQDIGNDTLDLGFDTFHKGHL